jgi:hypothetical protein
MSEQDNTTAILRFFQIPGDLAGVEPCGNGHINDTFCAVFYEAGRPARYILQRINSAIFKDPVALMQNIERVTSHLAAKVAAEPDAARRGLTLVPTHDGRSWHVDAEGRFWRVYRSVENARSYDAPDSPEQAFQAARAFGHFQQVLADLPAPRLHDTIPDFHHTPKRFLALEQAIDADAAGRAVLARPEIEFALARKSIVRVLLDAHLPERVTHNDTKLNNVMIDSATGEGICVIDLDTVMPGLALYDFGDMVRTGTCQAAEDERDLSKVNIEFPYFEALARGYLASAGTFLTPLEKQHLAFAGKLITFEQGIRFLTDFLAGDTYYKVHRPGQNLDRTRTQFKLVESIEMQEEAMNRLVESIEP